MTFARRLARVDEMAQQHSAERVFNKPARTFASQLDALKGYRSGRERKMPVRHVWVSEGGQALVDQRSQSLANNGMLLLNRGRRSQRQIRR